MLVVWIFLVLQEEKKQKEAEAKRKRLEDAEKKRQAMLEEQKKLKEGKPNFVIQKKGGGEAAPAVNPAAFDKVLLRVLL